MQPAEPNRATRRARSAAGEVAIDRLHVMVRDLDGTIRFWSRALQDLFGWSPEEAQGQIAHRFLATEFPRLLEDIEAELIREGSVELELCHRTKDGRRIVLASRWILKHDANGNPLSIVESAIDIGKIKAATERMRQREELLRLCIDAAPAGIAMFDLEMRYLAASRRHIDDLQIGGEPVIGRSYYEVVPEIPDHWRETHRRCLAGAHDGSEADSLSRADGTIEWYRWQARPWRTADGNPGGIVLFSENITERIRAQETLRERDAAARRTTELLDKMAVSMSDAVLVVDAGGRTLFANPACTALFGDHPYVGSEDWSKTFHRLRPDGVTPLPIKEAPISRAVRGENFDNVEGICRRVGEAHGRYLVASGRSIRSEAGEHEAAVIVYRDITELTEKTAALRRNAEILDSIMSSMAEAVILLDENAEVLFANSAAEAVLGSHMRTGLQDWIANYDLYGADGVTLMPVDQWPAARAVAGEQIDNLELTIRKRGQGSAIRLMLSARPIREATAAPKGAVLVFRDVTQAKDTEQQLHQSQKMDAIGQLAGGIAHDFNNLLTVITGTIEILADGVADRPELAAICAMIDESAERGSYLTQQLLAFGRRQPLQPRETDINDLMMQTTKLLTLTLGEHIEIDAMLHEDAWLAMVDPSQLSTAILNLALNARDAMPSGGKLTFETGNVVIDESNIKTQPEMRAGHYIYVAVSDTGTGIPSAIRHRVFEPFFTTKHAGKGTGLGLSMVYGFVKQSNGHVSIYSEIGHGTTVKLYLPRCDAQAVAVADVVSAAAPRGNETILVVEDDALVRNYVVAQLNSLGYTTLSAGSGAEALALVDQGAVFDLLFTDVIMPGMNGRQLADELARRRPSVRVLYTSGYTENAIGHHGRLDPGVALLSKPYRKTDLARKIREVLTAASRAA